VCFNFFVGVILFLTAEEAED